MKATQSCLWIAALAICALSTLAFAAEARAAWTCAGECEQIRQEKGQAAFDICVDVCQENRARAVRREADAAAEVTEEVVREGYNRAKRTGQNWRRGWRGGRGQGGGGGQGQGGGGGKGNCQTQETTQNTDQTQNQENEEQ